MNTPEAEKYIIHSLATIPPFQALSLLRKLLLANEYLLNEEPVDTELDVLDEDPEEERLRIDKARNNSSLDLPLIEVEEEEEDEGEELQLLKE